MLVAACTSCTQQRLQRFHLAGAGGGHELDLGDEEHSSTMMSHREFDNFLQEQQGASFQEALGQQIRQISVKAVSAVADRLERVGRGFEWLGLDFMVTEALEVLLLEVNVSPDLSRSGPL